MKTFLLIIAVLAVTGAIQKPESPSTITIIGNGTLGPKPPKKFDVAAVSVVAKTSKQGYVSLDIDITAIQVYRGYMLFVVPRDHDVFPADGILQFDVMGVHGKDDVVFEPKKKLNLVYFLQPGQQCKGIRVYGIDGGKFIEAKVSVSKPK